MNIRSVQIDEVETVEFTSEELAADGSKDGS